MLDYDLLSAVQPATGWYAIVGIKEGSVRQFLVETREEADDLADEMVRQKRNVFFGVAKYRDDSSRKKGNVQALRALWLDLDCGPGKPYAAQLDGMTALRAYVAAAKMPKPTVVDSGRGLHVYWPLTADVTREEWEPVAAALQASCRTHGLEADPTCFEVARILRVPGTYNFKGDAPLPVSVLMTGQPHTLEAIRERIGSVAVAQPAPRSAAPAASDASLSPMGQMIRDQSDKSFDKVMQSGCLQLEACYADRATLSEPRWFDALSVAKFCADRDTVIHKLSADHPGYDPSRTESKLDHIVGPHTCVQFEANNPGVCAGCKHHGKIKSPIVLGTTVKVVEAVDEEVMDFSADGHPTVYHIPEYPFPYVRGKNGGVWRKGDKGAEGEAGEDMLIYAYDLYMVKIMEDPAAGSVVLIRHHTPRAGVREFSMPTSQVMDANEVRKLLASKHIVAPKKLFDLLVDYMLRSFQKLFHTRNVEQMRNQFGWAEGRRKFIVGDREVTPEGTYHSPPTPATKAFAEAMQPVGTLEKWKEVFDLYGRPGLEGHAFAAATAFGAPLLHLSGQSGAIISLLHGTSGTGKTTALRMCNSVWGHPQQLCSTKDDTFNSKVFKMGVLNNLPTCFDEMTNTESKQLSELIYLVTQGRGKDRMKSSSNELRVNLTTWQTIALCSSNLSFYEKLEAFKGLPDGELMRVVEYGINPSTAIDPLYGKAMFDDQLMHNYGHAGEIFARYVVNNYEEVMNTFKHIQHLFDTKLNLTQRERFRSGTAAANLTGAHVATRLGLLSWDLPALFKWTCGMLMQLREQLATPPSLTAGNHEVLGDFLSSHLDHLLIVDAATDARAMHRPVPREEPTRELLARFEPDTKRLYIAAGALRSYCSEHMIGYRETLNNMKATGLFLGSGPRRLSKGMKITLPPVQALMFDGAHPDCIKLGGEDVEEVEIAVEPPEEPYEEPAAEEAE